MSNGNFNGTLGDGSPLVVVAISKADGDCASFADTVGHNGHGFGQCDVVSVLQRHFDGLSACCGRGGLGICRRGDNTSPLREVRTILQNSAQDLGTAGWDQYFGYGLVDADAAMSLIVPHTCTAVWTLGYGLAGGYRPRLFCELG